VKTDDLISALTETLAPVPRYAALLWLVEGIGAGALVSFVAMWTWLGVRPDLATAMTTSAGWMKFGYTLALALFAFWATERLARPSASARAAIAGAIAVFAVLFAFASMKLMMAPPAARMPMIMGSSAQVCPWRIVILSLPIFAGTFWSLRKLAPTRLALAGGVAGFASGALGAWVYAFHCDESAAPFLLVFYTFGIAIVGAAGSLIAGRVLRW
jgi:hypothetical protein